MDRVRRRFPHALELSFDPERAAVPVRAYAARLARRADVDVCCDFLDHVRGGRAATDEERALLTTALEASRVGRGCDDDEGLVRGARTVPDGGAAAGAA
jgi:exonuclease SbcD